MSERENVSVVQSVFEAFGRGDVEALLKLLTDDVRWMVSGPTEVPYMGDRRGREQVKEFFIALGSNVEFERFEPQEFVAQSERVVVLGSERGRVRCTGKDFDNDWAMVFTVRDGRVAQFRSYENTAAVADAFRAV